MSTTKLETNLKVQKQIAINLKKANRRVAAVGLPESKVGNVIYGDGITVVKIGIWHEFGIGNPERSWLRVPLRHNAAKLSKIMQAQYDEILHGRKTVDEALDFIGLAASNFCKGAFRARGYGEWKDISEATKQRKGSTGILIDTGTLRNSITWVVRNAT
jgi:hypothetical protein